MFASRHNTPEQKLEITEHLLTEMEKEEVKLLEKELASLTIELDRLKDASHQHEIQKASLDRNSAEFKRLDSEYSQLLDLQQKIRNKKENGKKVLEKKLFAKPSREEQVIIQDYIPGTNYFIDKRDSTFVLKFSGMIRYTEQEVKKLFEGLIPSYELSETEPNIYKKRYPQVKFPMKYFKEFLEALKLKEKKLIDSDAEYGCAAC